MHIEIRSNDALAALKAHMQETYDKDASEVALFANKERGNHELKVLRNVKMATSAVYPHMYTDEPMLSSDSSQGTASLSLRGSLRYVTEPPKWLLCPDCDQLLLEPVIAVSCGHTFCRSCSEQLKEHNRPCPLDSTPSGTNQFVPNRALGAQIDELEVHCPNSGHVRDGSADEQASGCKEKMKLCELSVHLKACPYGLVDCPQAGEVCGRIHRKDLAYHLEVCAHCSCIYQTVGESRFRHYQTVCGDEYMWLTLQWKLAA